MARLVDLYARRLQTQETMTSQFAHSLDESLRPKGVAVMIEAEHMCMAMRGIGMQGSKTLTTTFTGLFETSAADPGALYHACPRLTALPRTPIGRLAGGSND